MLEYATIVPYEVLGVLVIGKFSLWDTGDPQTVAVKSQK